MFTVKELQAIFEENWDQPDDAFRELPNKRASRRDLHAMILLDELVPSDAGYGRDIISHASHDEVWFSIDLEKLAEVITVDQIIELCKCGVMFCPDTSLLHIVV